MSAPRLTIRVQLQQDHGFSRPLFRKPQPRRWPWLLLLLLLAGGAVLVQQPQWLQSLSAALPKAPAANPPQPVAQPLASIGTSERRPAAVTAPPAAVAPAVKAEQASAPAVAEPTPPPVPQPVAPMPEADAAANAPAATATPAVAAAPVATTAPAATTAATTTVTTPAAAAPVPAVAAPQEVAERPVPATGPRVTRQQLTGAINSREPVGQLAGTLSAPTVVYFFNELTDMQGEQVRHRWYRDDQLIKERQINVGAVRWRTWSRHEIDSRSTGAWRVELLDGNGKLLASQQWQVTGSAP